jgi:P-type Ca2+ transporter type 2C
MLKLGTALPDHIQGLTPNEVISSKEKYGNNQLSRRERNTFFHQLIDNFKDPIINILLMALAINILFAIKNFEWYESAGIAIAILLAAFLSTISEYGSEKAFEKLQKEANETVSKVKRSNGLFELPINDIVVGDYIFLQAGEKIPADGVIVSGELYVDQSALNGESKEVYKTPANIRESNHDKANFMQKDRLFRGSIVCSGEGVMLVTQVGNNTFYGKIAQEIQEEQRDSPLKLRLKKLAQTISRFGYMGAGAVVVADLFNSIVMDQGFDMERILAVIKTPPILLGNIFHAITLAVTIIVVAVPEGLPMMITVVLSSNMKRMLKDNVLVRKLVGIETSGSLNILFTDKTGTITKGKLQVISILSGNCTEYTTAAELSGNPELYNLFDLSAVYNTSCSITNSGETTKVIGGNATERAILEFFTAHTQKHQNAQIKSRIPFNSVDKFSAAEITDRNRQIVLIKGAPEKILANCTRYYDANGTPKALTSLNSLQKMMNKMAGKSIRLLAVATSDTSIKDTGDIKNLTLIGIIGIRDDVRPEAAAAIRQVIRAGIQVVMITGDNKDTALAIAQEAGLMGGDQESAILTSSELALLTDDELEKILPKLRVVARALPSDKSRLIKVSQQLGLVAGMTGDGVNDAPALKKADVGFSMGSGTEIAKEASDIVIMDDNFHSISKAILYGRNIFKSIRKFIIFQLTVNLCAVIVSIIGPFIGVHTPITVLQMLWINMIMDTLAGLAYSGEAALEEYMNEPPKRRDEPIINLYMMTQIGFTGIYTAALCILFLKAPIIPGLFRGSEGSQYMMTAFFGLFIFASIFNSLNARTYRLNLLAYIEKNRYFMIIMTFVVIVQILLIYYGGPLFRTSGLSLSEFFIVLVLAFTVIPIDMLRKIFIRLKGHKGNV